jgi:hypothetical protein
VEKDSLREELRYSEVHLVLFSLWIGIEYCGRSVPLFSRNWRPIFVRSAQFTAMRASQSMSSHWENSSWTSSVKTEVWQFARGEFERHNGRRRCLIESKKWIALSIRLSRRESV